jgi:PAS domain S-box-containing protein
MNTTSILIVEDENIVALDIKYLLESLGYGVAAVVSSGEEAIQKAAETRPDLVLMDVKLEGGMDGVEAAEHIQAQSDTPVIYLTAYADHATLERAKITQPFGYILKPFEEKELHTTIEMALYRHGMEKKLKANERWLATTLKSIGDAVIATDAHGHVEFMNPVAEALTGWGQAEALGQEITRVFHIVNGQTRRRVENPVAKALRDRVVVGLGNHTLLVAKDGTEIPIDDNAAPIRDDQGHITGAVLIFHDISDRVQAEKAIQRLGTAIQQAAESVVITDTQGTVVYANPAFERITGYRQAEVVGHRTSLLRSEEQDPASYQELWTTITAGEVWQGRLVNRRKDGVRYIADTIITPVRDENGAIVNYVSLQRDVTRELQLEEQYHQAQKMEAVGLLAGGIAHDFNNLLTAINGFAELIQFSLSAQDPTHELAGKILQSGRRAADLVRQLLAFSRKQIVHPKLLNLNAVVAELDDMLPRIIGEHIYVETHLAPDLWPVTVDRTQIDQAIVNLVVNARDAMPAGGRLTVETANVRLDEAYVSTHLEVQPGEYVLLAISDTGIGMSEEVKAHIFEPFFTTKGVGKGTGLGLATVHGIVKQSGGHVWAYSELGHGTTFKIYLPRAEGASPEPAGPQAGADVPYGNETILLVEDDDRVRELARRVLQIRGYNLLEARDGQQALQVATEHGSTIHLLLTDVVMPGMSGSALAAQLTQILPGLKVLFMSGYTDEAITHHGVLDPGVAFVQKPFSPAALARKVREVLDG